MVHSWPRIFVMVHLCWSCTFVLIKHVAYLNSVSSRSIENNQSSKLSKPDPDSIKLPGSRYGYHALGLCSGVVWIPESASIRSGEGLY